MTGGERTGLDHSLDLYRDTALLKITGLDAEQLPRRPVPPSALSLIGVQAARLAAVVPAAIGEPISPINQRLPMAEVTVPIGLMIVLGTR